MVFQLLSLRWRMPQKGFSCHQKVWSGLKKSRIYKEIFLLPAKCSRNFGYIFIKILTNLRSRLIHSVQRSQKRSFVIQCFACIGNKNRRNTKGSSHNKRWRSRIPSGIASRLKGVSNSSIRERRRVWLLLNKVRSVKAFHGFALTYRREKGIVFFCGSSCQRLEPMRVVSNAFGHRPIFHAESYLVCY